MGIYDVLDVIQPLGQAVQTVGNPEQLLLVLAAVLLVSEQHDPENVTTIFRVKQAEPDLLSSLSGTPKEM